MERFTDMNVSICAIILNWNNFIDTVDCVNSLRNSTYPVLEKDVIIVDNGSSDDSSKSIGKLFPGAHCIYNGTNLGYAAGINVGVRYALEQGYEYLLLINNDAVVAGDCLQRLFNAFTENRNVGIAGPSIYYFKKPDVIWQAGGYFSYIQGGNIVPEKNKTSKRYRKEYVESSFLTGCIILLRRRTFEAIGLFDEDMFFYEEDIDFCLRAVKAKFRLIYVPSAKAWHKVDGIKITPFAFYHRAKSRILYLRKNFKTPYYLYALFTHAVFYTPYKFFQVIREKQPLPTFHAWLQGTIDGLLSRKSITL